MDSRLSDGSAAIETERFVQPEGVCYEEHGGYGLLHTPCRLDYRAGNALLSRVPVTPGELEFWHAEWLRCFRDKPLPMHFVLEWEESLDGRPAFGTPAPGMAVTQNVSLRLGELVPLEPPSWPCRRFASDDDWAGLIDLVVEEDDGNAATEDFLRWQIGAYRKAVEAGRAEWWGVWREGVLLGAAGLFRFDGGVRLEEVLTRAAGRGQGICTSLCHALLTREVRRGLEGEAWVVTAEGSAAERIYRRLGFQPHSRLWTIVASNPA